MPFTFSHPALIIPLLRVRPRYRWFSATGLVAGSVAPDFEKFFKLHLASGYSHTLASIFYFSLPVSLALAFLFHQIVRRPLLAHLPGGLRRRLGQYAGFDWPRHFRRHYKGVLLSMVLGAAGHLFWDLFTHPSVLLKTLLPMMETTVPVGSRRVSLYKVSGVVNSVLGGLAIVWATWRLPAHPGAESRPRAWWAYWGLAALVAGALLALWAQLAVISWLSLGITAISAGMVGVVVASVCFRLGATPPPLGRERA
ncbi:hypothetical protein GCM10023185_00190 [Hymenobacter saemangeumensis]|uniref:DUF4184 family protein n=1 Tax=Hymenobacter saemangeumensis TaxID=1084522 RepID=A0ABP8HWA0_9BACT